MRVLTWAKDYLDCVERMCSYSISALRMQAAMMKIVGNDKMRSEITQAILDELNMFDESLSDLEEKFIETLERETETMLGVVKELAESAEQVAKISQKNNSAKPTTRSAYEQRRQFTKNLGQYEIQMVAEIGKQFKAMRKKIHELRETLLTK